MRNDLIELENEVRSVEQDKGLVTEQLAAFQQHLHENETWLRWHLPATEGYQETLEELGALQAYVGELQAQVVALDDLLLELLVEWECWENPDLLRAS
jgi:hypothetical protein